MPRLRKKEAIVCPHFRWLLGQRNGVWFADGRSNVISVGRHSLGTRDFEEARGHLLPRLDLTMAVRHKLADPSLLNGGTARPLPIAEGRMLYLQHASRPRITGGVKESSSKRYRAVFEKFEKFVETRRISDWNRVTAGTLNDYAVYLTQNGYGYYTLYTELNTLKQGMGWLIKHKHLPAECRIELLLRKPEGTNTYCYRKAEVRAMLEHCATDPELTWLRGVIIALAFTGLRICALASLRWSDIDLASRVLDLVDETACLNRNGRDVRTTKSGRGRSLPIRDELYEVLQSLPRMKDGYVFRGPRGGRLTPDLARRRLISAVLTPLEEKFPTLEGDRGFADGRLHSFRHFFCSFCANSAVPEQTVMKWLGHRNSAMVRHYYHLNDHEARRHMQRLSLDDETECDAA